MPGLHISQGIFLKIFNLLENACHDLDVKMALIHSGQNTLSPSYTHHVLNLQELTVAIRQYNSSVLANFDEHWKRYHHT